MQEYGNVKHNLWLQNSCRSPQRKPILVIKAHLSMICQKFSPGSAESRTHWKLQSPNRTFPPQAQLQTQLARMPHLFMGGVYVGILKTIGITWSCVTYSNRAAAPRCPSPIICLGSVDRLTILKGTFTEIQGLGLLDEDFRTGRLLGSHLYECPDVNTITP